ncbi:MAG: DNA translocase FtsK 4TM domain-containing protein, partial [Pseudomonadota bacterium]
MAEKTNVQPLPEKIVALLQEARWFALAAAAVYLGLVLGGFDPADPGWSHAAQVDHIANPGGRFGAWLADLLLYLFGISAWWWVMFLLFAVIWGYRRLDSFGFLTPDRRPFLIATSGFILLLIGSCGIEAMRFYSLNVALPQTPGGMPGPGGMVGYEIGKLTANLFGYSGGTLILLAMLAAGISLAVCTASTPENMKLAFARFPIDRWVETVVSPADGLRGKPHPDIFLEAAR